MGEQKVTVPWELGQPDPSKELTGGRPCSAPRGQAASPGSPLCVLHRGRAQGTYRAVLSRLSAQTLQATASRPPFCSQAKITEGEATPSTLDKQVPPNTRIQAPSRCKQACQWPRSRHAPRAGVPIPQQHPLLSGGLNKKTSSMR